MTYGVFANHACRRRSPENTDEKDAAISGLGERLGTCFQKWEADVMRPASPKHVTSAAGFCRAPLGLIIGILRMLLGLGGIFLALGVVVFVVSVGCGAMRLRCGLVLLGRLVVRVFHVAFSCWPKNIGWCEHGYSPRHPQPAQRQWNKQKAMLPLFNRSSAAQRSRPTYR